MPAGADHVAVNTDGTGGARAVFEQSQDWRSLAMGDGGRLRLAPGNLLIDVQTSVTMPSSGFELDLTGRELRPPQQHQLRLLRGPRHQRLQRRRLEWTGHQQQHRRLNSAGRRLGIGGCRRPVRRRAGNIGGIALQPGDLIVRYTLYGDANLDRSVKRDRSRSPCHQLATDRPSMESGDSNYDHMVDVTDLGALATNWQVALPAPPLSIQNLIQRSAKPAALSATLVELLLNLFDLEGTMSHANLGRRSSCEPLEPRVMLSTINWVNRGHATTIWIYSAPTKMSCAPIVDRAIDDWERVIVNFNYGDGTNTFNLTVLGFPGFPGQTVNITPDADGKSRSATVRLNPTTAQYFDTVTGTAQVPDDSEYNNLITPFSAGGGPVNQVDMYSVVSHEIGHALGVVYQSNLAIHNFVDLNVWAIDPNNPGDGCPPNEPGCVDPGNHVYPVMVNGQVRYSMTDAGGFDYPHQAVHLYEGPAVNGWPIHPNDLLDDGRTSDLSRRLMSDTTVGFLRDVYGYTVALPSQTNTFYANFNTTTGSLKVQGDPDDADDSITIDVVGANVRVAGKRHQRVGSQLTHHPDLDFFRRWRRHDQYQRAARSA